MIRALIVAAMVFSAGCVKLNLAPSATTKPVSTQPVVDPAAVEARIASRATKTAEKLKLDDPAKTLAARDAIHTFYRDLNAAHADRDAKLMALGSIDLKKLDRVRFNSAKQVSDVYGQLIGSLAKVLDDKQIAAVEDAMTFDMVPSSFESYQRMFRAMTDRHKAQLYAWLVETRQAAVIAGSAETKLDAFRVNKLRMHAYLTAQGFDVETAVKAEEARKAAEKKEE